MTKAGYKTELNMFKYFELKYEKKKTLSYRSLERLPLNSVLGF